MRTRLERTRLDWRSSLLAVGIALSAAPAWAASPPALILYSAQHEQMVDMLAAGFTKTTGIAVQVHSGEAPEIASQLAQEGDASPADIYFTENSPELTLLDEKGLLAPVAAATLAQTHGDKNAATGNWVGVLARENVLAFNPAMIAANQMPVSLLDLARPQWRGKIAIAPTDADFLPLIGAVTALAGRPAALAWLQGLRVNAQVFDDDEGVALAVERGGAAVGIVNSYYWARMRTEAGAGKAKSQIYHFAGGDVGGLIDVSGAAVLKSSKNQEAGQRFLAYLVSRPVQEMLAAGEIDFEYPLATGVAANPLLKPMAQLQPPAISMAQIGDDADAARLLREAGLL